MGVVKAGGKEVRKEKGADIPLLEYIQFLTLKIGKTQKIRLKTLTLRSRNNIAIL